MAKEITAQDYEQFKAWSNDPDLDPAVSAMAGKLAAKYEAQGARSVDLTGLLGALPQRDSQENLDATAPQPEMTPEEQRAMLDRANGFAHENDQPSPGQVGKILVNTVNGAGLGVPKMLTRFGAAALSSDPQATDQAIESATSGPEALMGNVAGGFLSGSLVAKLLGGLGLAGASRYAPYLAEQSQVPGAIRTGAQTLLGAGLGATNVLAQEGTDYAGDKAMGSPETFGHRLDETAQQLPVAMGVGALFGGLGELASRYSGALRSPSSPAGQALADAEATGTETGLFGLRPPENVKALYATRQPGESSSQIPMLDAVDEGLQGLSNTEQDLNRVLGEEKLSYLQGKEGRVGRPPKASLNTALDVLAGRKLGDGTDAPFVDTNGALAARVKRMAGPPVIRDRAGAQGMVPGAERVLPLPEAMRLGIVAPGDKVKIQQWVSAADMGGGDPTPRPTGSYDKVPFSPDALPDALKMGDPVVVLNAKRMNAPQMEESLDAIDRLAKAGKASGDVDPLYKQLQRSFRDDRSQFAGNIHTARFPEATVGDGPDAVKIPAGSYAAMMHEHGKILEQMENDLKALGLQKGFNPTDPHAEEAFAGRFLNSGRPGASHTAEARLELLAGDSPRFAKNLEDVRALNAFEHARGQGSSLLGSLPSLPMGVTAEGVPIGAMLKFARNLDPLARGIDASALGAGNAVNTAMLGPDAIEKAKTAEGLANYGKTKVMNAAQLIRTMLGGAL